jgi:biotin carboxylase
LTDRLDESIVLVNPCHEYAVRFVELAFERYHCQTVCVYTDPRERAAAERRFAILRSRAVAGRHRLDRRGLVDLAARIREWHRPLAVVPFSEQVVGVSSELSAALGLDWNRLEVMRRFRDKFALKQFLRASRPDIRVNESILVRSAAAVFAADAGGFPRFVLKPNDGYGNRDIGVFDRTAARESIEQFFAMRPGRDFVLEDFIQGTEYFVNGQTDGRGGAHAVAIFEYGRTVANGREGIDFTTRLVHRYEPAFSTAECYARSVVEATGLRRSPFHLELKIDARGPCLIDVAARLAGNQNAFLCSTLHGDQLDLFDVALYHYLRTDDEDRLRPDWSRYDSIYVQYVHGIATRREIIVELQGTGEVEALPSFRSWAKKPRVGDRIRPTLDALTMPWSLALANRSPEALSADANAARALIRWNASVGVVRRVSARIAASLRGRYEDLRDRVAGSGDEHLRRAVRDVAALSGAAQQSVARKLNSLVQKLQRQGLVRRMALPEPLSASRLTEAETVFTWVRDYLGESHPGLGRKGPICPFVKLSVAKDLLRVAFHDEVDGSSAAPVREIILNHADAFLARFPSTRRDRHLAALMIVFPAIRDEQAPLLDDIHNELKTDMMRRGLMVSSVHKNCPRPAISNPDFAVSRAPFTAFAIRSMVVQDIVFVGHNEAAFAVYRARFGSLFAKDKVSNEFGAVDGFREAEGRFGRR